MFPRVLPVQLSTILKPSRPYRGHCLQPPLASNIYNKISSKLQRGAYASEFTRALNLYRASIDKDIHNNGYSAGDKQKGYWGKNVVQSQKGIMVDPLMLFPEQLAPH